VRLISEFNLQTLAVRLDPHIAEISDERPVPLEAEYQDAWPTSPIRIRRIITTMGSQYWLIIRVGRVLCLILSLYGFAVHASVTAALASLFIGQEAENRAGALPPSRHMQRLELEFRRLREVVQDLKPSGSR
jgi:hypothetical protein